MKRKINHGPDGIDDHGSEEIQYDRNQHEISFSNLINQKGIADQCAIIENAEYEDKPQKTRNQAR